MSTPPGQLSPAVEGYDVDTLAFPLTRFQNLGIDPGQTATLLSWFNGLAAADRYTEVQGMARLCNQDLIAWAAQASASGSPAAGESDVLVDAVAPTPGPDSEPPAGLVTDDPAPGAAEVPAGEATPPSGSSAGGAPDSPQRGPGETGARRGA
jgi:hypothetical protein